MVDNENDNNNGKQPFWEWLCFIMVHEFKQQSIVTTNNNKYFFFEKLHGVQEIEKVKCLVSRPRRRAWLSWLSWLWPWLQQLVAGELRGGFQSSDCYPPKHQQPKSSAYSLGNHHKHHWKVSILVEKPSMFRTDNLCWLLLAIDHCWPKEKPYQESLSNILAVIKQYYAILFMVNHYQPLLIIINESLAHHCWSFLSIIDREPVLLSHFFGSLSRSFGDCFCAGRATRKLDNWMLQ